MLPTFENRVTQNLAQWISGIEVSDDAKSLRIQLTHNLHHPVVERCIYITGVTKVVSKWHDRVDGCMESIIGAHEERIGTEFRYMFHTEQRELWIWAEFPALVLVGDN